MEVRVAQLSKHGMLSFRLKPNDEGTFDVLALVVKGSEVYYLPQIPGTTLCPYKIQVDSLTRLRYWGVLRGALPYQGFQAAVQEEA